MSLDAANFQTLRRRTWVGRPGRFRWAQQSARVLSLVMLVCFAAGIWFYLRVTDPRRVRSMAEGFLGRVVDGTIRIGEARLSIFEGLQLDNVSIANRGDSPNANVITARQLQISYSPLALLTGRLESGRVTVIEPEVFLVEDVDNDRWNVQDLRHPRPATRPTTTQTTSFRPPPLPEVLIRNGRVHRAQVVGGRYEMLQSMRLEGQLLPNADATAGGDYTFNLQTRTDGGLGGPAFQGKFSIAEAAATSSLTNVELRDLEAMLPARVRTFWQKLSPSGRVNVPVLSIARRDAGGRDGFRIELQLDDVQMQVRPTDWASAREQFVLSEARTVSAAVRGVSGAPMGMLASAVALQPQLRTGMIPLDEVVGRFVFTDDGVTLDKLSATIDGNRFDIHGRLDGYTFDAPMTLGLASPAERPIRLRDRVPYINALPAEIREVYYRFRPQGRCNVNVSLSRATAGGPLGVLGSLEFASADFLFEPFPYPVRNASGRLTVDADPRTREPRLVIDHIRGNGPDKGVNADGQLGVSGVISPLIGHASVDVMVSGSNIESEPALIAALPPEARAVLAEFDDDGPGPNPTFGGDFSCHVHREPGPVSKWTYDTDVKVRDGRGAIRAFAYPIEKLEADLRIRKDHVQIVSARSRRGDASVSVSGLTEWGTRVNPNRRIGEPGARTRLTLAARALPIDATLLAALPEDARRQLERFGVGGTVDVTGPLAIDDPKKGPSFDLTLQWRDGRLAPPDAKTSVEKISGTLQLTPRSLKIDRVTGRRGESSVSADGTVDWSDPASPNLELDLKADILALDASLRDSLPEGVRKVWDLLQPAGRTDLAVALKGPASKLEWTLDLHPLGAQMTPGFFPLPMTEIKGSVRATADRIDFQRLTGNVAGGAVEFGGLGEFSDDRSAWTLHFGSSDTLIDAAFRDALPTPLKRLLTENGVAGRADLNFRRLAWTTAAAGGATDIVFDASMALRDSAWNAGVSIDQATGTFDLNGHFIDDEAAELAGELRLKTFRLAGLDAREGAATIVTDRQQRRIDVKDIRARIGEGDVAGEVGLDRSRADSTRWTAEFLLRNADVSALAASPNAPLTGRLNASLSVGGAWSADGKPSGGRRGRGDISVTGDRMLNVPMLLGVTQIVSLSLPFTSGFNEATASYSLDDERVSFSDITLQSNEMKIKGAGWLDFEKRQVNLDFHTASAGQRLPVIGHLLDAARKELFQIKVRGTLSEPKVTAGSLQTVTTTVDEILGTEKK